MDTTDQTTFDEPPGLFHEDTSRLAEHAAAVDAPAPAAAPSTALAAIEPTALADVNVETTMQSQIVNLFRSTESVITALVARHKDVVHDLKTPAGLASAKAARLELRERARFPLQRAAEAVKKALNDLKPIVEAESARLIALTKPLEDQLHTDIGAREKEIEDEKERLRQVEAARVAKHQENLARIPAYVVAAAGHTPEAIEGAARKLATTIVGPEWQEFQTHAMTALQKAVDDLLALAAKKRADAAAEEARLRADAEAKQRAAELDTVRATQRAQEERVTRLAEFAEWAARGPIESEEDANLVRGIVLGLAGVDLEWFGRMKTVASLSIRAAIDNLNDILATWDVVPVPELPAAPAPAAAPITESAWDPAAAAPPPPITESAWMDAAPVNAGPDINAFDVAIIGATMPQSYSDIVPDIDPADATLNLGALSEWLGFTVTRTFVVETLAVPARRTEGRSVLWAKCDAVTIAARIGDRMYDLAEVGY